MPTYAPASGQIKLSQIKAAFGNNKNSLSQYRSLRWYKNPFAYGNFSATTIKFSDFYSTGDTVTPTPSGQTVVIGGVTYNYTRISASTTAPIGAFNVMSIEVKGGGGGVQGSPGNTGEAGILGSDGGSSVFSGVTATGGLKVAYPGSPSSGFSQQFAWTAASNADKIGVSTAITVGGGGAGGLGGKNYNIVNGQFVDAGTRGATGASGSNGYVDFYWY